MGRERFDGPDYVVLPVETCQVSARTGLQQRFYASLAAIDRKDEDLSSPHARANLARHFDGADEGQQVVDHSNVWLGFEGFEDRLFPIGGFGDDLPVRAGFQHFPQRGSDHLMFIGNENAGHLTDTFTSRRWSYPPTDGGLE